MHIPGLYRKRSFHIFLLGVVAGSLVAYIVFTYMYGKMYEDILVDKMQLQTKVTDLQRQNDVLLQDKEDLQEKSRTLINEITITFTNAKELKLDRLMAHELETLLKQELEDIIGKESHHVAMNDDLLVLLIESKQYVIDDLTYEFIVEKIAITDTIKLTLSINLTK